MKAGWIRKVSMTDTLEEFIVTSGNSMEHEELVFQKGRRYMLLIWQKLWGLNVKAADAWSVNPYAHLLLSKIHIEHSATQFYRVQKIYNISSINLNCLLSAMLKMCLFL